jgi:predicted permease
LSTKEAKGIEIFVGTFALPAMIFTALCTLDLSSVNWKFVLSIFITKTIIFLAVVVVTLLVNHGHNVGKAGLYSIFVTQSNDFALGYPILNALYRQSYPEYPSYLYLLSPISLAILNPIGCILMEVDKVKSSNDTSKLEEEGNSSSTVNSTPQHTRKECEQNGTVKMDEHQIDVASKITTNIDTNNKDYENKWQRYRKGTLNTLNVEDSSVEQLSSEIWCPRKAKTVGKIVLGVFSNPIIILTFAGLIFGQFVFHGQMPPVINNFLQTLKNAYSATALFALGLGMVGKMEALKNGSKLLGPFILIVTKIILMPLVAREITNLLSAGSNEEETSRLADFAFLYGTFPTTPTVYVLATRYGIASSIIATTMIACTFLSAPIMFLSGIYHFDVFLYE